MKTILILTIAIFLAGCSNRYPGREEQKTEQELSFMDGVDSFEFRKNFKKDSPNP